MEPLGLVDVLIGFPDVNTTSESDLRVADRLGLDLLDGSQLGFCTGVISKEK